MAIFQLCLINQNEIKKIARLFPLFMYCDGEETICLAYKHFMSSYSTWAHSKLELNPVVPCGFKGIVRKFLSKASCRAKLAELLFTCVYSLTREYTNNSKPQQSRSVFVLKGLLF